MGTRFSFLHGNIEHADNHGHIFDAFIVACFGDACDDAACKLVVENPPKLSFFQRTLVECFDCLAEARWHGGFVVNG